MLTRPKIPAIYNTVNGWWNNDGGIYYIAHFITRGPVATPIKTALTVSEGGGPNQHPDQRYWQGLPITKPANLIRIEIDCTLMPCDADHKGCLYPVQKPNQ